MEAAAAVVLQEGVVLQVAPVLAVIQADVLLQVVQIAVVPSVLRDPRLDQEIVRVVIVQADPVVQVRRVQDRGVLQAVADRQIQVAVAVVLQSVRLEAAVVEVSQVIAVAAAAGHQAGMLQAPAGRVPVQVPAAEAGVIPAAHVHRQAVQDVVLHLLHPGHAEDIHAPLPREAAVAEVEVQIDKQSGSCGLATTSFLKSQ